ncbi:MAG TPA: hypothetical protein VFR12_08320 [Pyrinomonadaceae bacterium]|nr:hypothetical protein [Pyrinomonadaceae bacterium]
MMRQVSAHQQLFEPAVSTSARAAGVNHLLLAIGRAMSPPVVHMRTTFQPLRVIVVQPGLTPTTARNNLRVIPPPAKVADMASEKQSTTLDEKASKPVSLQIANDAASVSYRKLFNEPGQWRVVTWGEFKEILAPQLVHPERLRDTYRLPCYVQVVETNRDVQVEELAAEFSSKDSRPKPLYFLTDEIAAKLELTSLLPPLPARRPGPRASNVLLAHERVFRLLVANDPTVDVGSARRNRAPESNLRKAIPTSFIREWEFKISREEALYDIGDKSLFSALRKFTRKLRVFKQYSEFRKWQALITGKSHDDQLWSVRPPANMLGHTFVREWVKKTLDLAGYDSEVMLPEWEIFWRRKGFF